MALGLIKLLTEMSTMYLPGGKAWWHVRLTSSSLPVSQLPRKCGSLNISQPYGPLLPVTGVAILIVLPVVLYD
jgi:hypothetical protein